MAKSSALQGVGDVELEESLKSLLKAGAGLEAQIVVHLGEVHARSMHLKAGYSSLFKYCVVALGFSEFEAVFRITAARLGRRFPLIVELLERRAIHLSAVHLLRRFLTQENHQELLAEACHKSKREIEALLARRYPREDVATSLRKLPQLEPLSPGRYRLELTIDEADKQELELACDLLTGVHGTADAAVVFRRGVRLVVNDAKKRRFGRQSARAASHAAPSTITSLVIPPVTDQLTTDQLTTDQLTTDQLTTDHAIVQQPGAQQPGAQQPGAQQPGAQQPGAQQAAVVVRHSRSQTAPVQNSGSQDPPVQCPGSQQPVLQHAPVRHSGSQRSGSQRPVLRHPAEQHSVLQRPIVQQPGVQHTVAKRPVGQQEVAEMAHAEMAHAEMAHAEMALDGASVAVGPRSPGAPKQKREHIPRRVTSAVALRDDFRCSFVAVDGRRCETRSSLQIHHDVAWALGGSDMPENLRLLCADHNRYLANEVFGTEHVQAAIQRSRTDRRGGGRPA